MTMMQTATTEGLADSGLGVRIWGFYSQNHEVSKKLSEIPKDFYTSRIVQAESNGYLGLVAIENTCVATGRTELAIFRREPHKFFADLGDWLLKLKCAYVADLFLSESYGSLTLTLLYIPAGDN